MSRTRDRNSVAGSYRGWCCCETKRSSVVVSNILFPNKPCCSDSARPVERDGAGGGGNGREVDGRDDEVEGE